MASAICKVGVDEYENADLRRKLQSKAEALFILSKELDQCRTERDQFKLMAEQLQDRYSMLKKTTHDMGFTKHSILSDSLDHRPGTSLAQVLCETKELNKALKIEVEDLREKLRDAQGDIKALRARFSHQNHVTVMPENQPFPTHQREELVQQLETLNVKYMQMSSDLQSVLDEKQDLVTERDSYKCKVHRLNHELNSVLKGDVGKLVDVDALVMENRYFQERLHQAEEEKEMAKQALIKYKSMLEKKRSKGSVKFGTNNNSGMVMTHKQVQQLLEKGTEAQLPNTAATLSDMKSLCVALLETVGDKTLAFSHQKKANRILATRICELEQRLEAIQGGSIAASPSQLLLHGYGSSDVDRDVERILAQDAVDSDSDCETDCPNNADVKKTTRHSVARAPVVDTQTKDELNESISISKLDLENVSERLESYEALSEDSLPPELRRMVDKALEELKSDSKNQTS